MNDQEWYERYFVPGQREWIRGRTLKSFAKGLLIGLMIGVVLGYAWHFKQVTQSHEDQIAKITAKYLDARDRIADLEAKLGVKHGKGVRK